MAAPLSLTRYTHTDEAGRPGVGGVIVLFDAAYRARHAWPGQKILTVRLTTAEDDRPPVWYAVTRRRWRWWGPVELVETFGVAQAFASRALAEESAAAAGGKVTAVRIDWRAG
jgi:hypothetical protein